MNQIIVKLETAANVKALLRSAVENELKILLIHPGQLFDERYAEYA